MTLRITEKQITRAVVEHWRMLGLPGTLVASIPNEGAKGQYGLRKGLPDLMVISPSLPVGFMEIKTATGTLKPDQAEFAQLCTARGIPHVVTFGRDDPIRALEDWGVIRKGARL